LLQICKSTILNCMYYVPQKMRLCKYKRNWKEHRSNIPTRNSHTRIIWISSKKQNNCSIFSNIRFVWNRLKLILTSSSSISYPPYIKLQIFRSILNQITIYTTTHSQDRAMRNDMWIRLPIICSLINTHHRGS